MNTSPAGPQGAPAEVTAEHIAAADDALLRLHLASQHALAGLGFDDPAGLHEQEHDGPCTIRDHPRESSFWDPTKVATVLMEGAEMDGLITFASKPAS